MGPGSWKFCDRNVDDVKDGYVSCQPFQDTRKWGLVRKMLRTKMSYKLANILSDATLHLLFIRTSNIEQELQSVEGSDCPSIFLVSRPAIESRPIHSNADSDILVISSNLDKNFL